MNPPGSLIELYFSELNDTSETFLQESGLKGAKQIQGNMNGTRLQVLVRLSFYFEGNLNLSWQESLRLPIKSANTSPNYPPSPQKYSKDMNRSPACSLCSMTTPTIFLFFPWYVQRTRNCMYFYFCYIYHA